MGPSRIGTELSRFTSPEDWPKYICKTCSMTYHHPAFQEVLECEKCRDGREAAERRQIRAQREQEAQSREQERLAGLRGNLQAHMTAAGVPTGYLRYTKASWERLYGPWRSRDSTAQLERWPSEGLDPQEWLVIFYGPYGRRKTSMATSLLSEAIMGDMSCQWWDMNHYLAELKVGIRRERAEADVISGKIRHLPRELESVKPYSLIQRRAWDCDFLVIDDLGSLKGARSSRDSWWKEEIGGLLRHRHAWVRPTVVTTNGKIENLDVIDPSLVSRMDVELAFDMDVDGIDHRRQDAHSESVSGPRRTT